MEIFLDFEKEATKELLSNYDFEFFLKEDFNQNNYSKENIDSLYKSFNKHDILIKEKRKSNITQYNYYLEGMVRKMYIGGLLPCLFHLNNAKGHTITDFVGFGENWAYFNNWQHYYKRKVTKTKVWDYIVKSGGILAILLSLQKVYEILHLYKLL